MLIDEGDSSGMQIEFAGREPELGTQEESWGLIEKVLATFTGLLLLVIVVLLFFPRFGQ